MNTLEMAIELRKNPKLKAQRTNKLGEVWKVKCVDGNIIWDNDNNQYGTFLNMQKTILDCNDWSLIEELKLCTVYYHGKIELINGIGNLPDDKEPIGDIYVFTSDEKQHTIRPIGRKFAIPTDDKEVTILYKYNCLATCVTIK